MLFHQSKTHLGQPSQMILLALAAMIGISTSAFLPNATNRTCGTSIVPRDTVDRLVGAKRAIKGEFPWMVSLRMRDDKNNFYHKCGAAILNERWIITAAQCLPYAYRDRYEVILGLHRSLRMHEPEVRIYKVAKFVVHETFVDNNMYVNDIALVKTSWPIDMRGTEGYINTICLPEDKKDPTGQATVAGWGNSRMGDYLVDELRKIVVPIVDRKKCRDSYANEDSFDDLVVVNENMICAGKTGVDICQGDLGGPIFQTDKNGVSTLIGIASSSVTCGAIPQPTIYTKVSMFLDWIKDVIKK